MAVDTEPKRWAMLRAAGGVAPSIVLNPTGSDADTATERLTVVGVYGALVTPSPAEETTGAGGANASIMAPIIRRKRKKKKQRRLEKMDHDKSVEDAIAELYGKIGDD